MPSVCGVGMLTIDPVFPCLLVCFFLFLILFLVSLIFLALRFLLERRWIKGKEEKAEEELI